MSGILLDFNIINLCIVGFINFTFVWYNLYINYYRLKHMSKLLKSYELDNRNSPLEKRGSIFSRVLFLGKDLCDVGLNIGGLLEQD